MNRSDYEVAIIGAGIAGAGLAAEIGAHRRTVILEGEDQPGYHSTGRSAAFWRETYGGAGVQPLSSASAPLLMRAGALQPLGAVQLGRAEDAPLCDAFLSEFAGSGIDLSRVDPAKIIPGLMPDWVIGTSEPSCCYIDVAAVFGDALSRARRAGVVVQSRARLHSARLEHGRWHLNTAAGGVTADVLVNAAGAWADDVARMAGVQPLGIQPYRRTVVQLRMEQPLPPGLPHVSDFAGSFYFKPEGAQRLWLSPHDETPSLPCDAAAEDLDVAIAIDRFQRVVDWPIAAAERKWAGLRSFAPDRLPVYGYADDCSRFFWCAGQGGFGIQTAPAASLIAAALLLDAPCDAAVAMVDPTPYRPGRFAG